MFLARLIPKEVSILPETGRAILRALGFGSDPGTNGAGVGVDVGADANASTGARSLNEDEGEDDYAAKEEEEAAGVGAGGEKRTGRRTRTRTRTTLAWMRAVTRGGQSVMQNDDGEGVTYEQASSWFWSQKWAGLPACRNNTHKRARFFVRPHPLAGIRSFYHD